MAFPLCKLITLTGPQGFPDSVVLSIIAGDERFEARRLALKPIERIELNLFEFDNQDLLPFQNEVQLKLGLNELGGSHQDLGVVIVSADDVNKGELTQRFSGVGVGPFYELTYKVL